MSHATDADIGNSDRRRGVRIPALATCWIARDSVTLMGRVTNLSDGGLFVLTPCSICRGSGVELSLNIGGKLVEASGCVAWCGGTDEADGPGLGIQFDRVMNGREYLERFLDDLLGRLS